MSSWSANHSDPLATLLDGVEVVEVVEAANREFSNKRQKIAVNKAVAEFVCPITHSLPVDPVAAEDGQVYERSAIVQWMQKQEKSPMTNKPMGTKLVTLTPVRSMIRTMVENGQVEGDIVDAWQKKLNDERIVAAITRLAKEGNTSSMLRMGFLCTKGDNGVEKDLSKAFEWFMEAHKAGRNIATSIVGLWLLRGTGVKKNVENGIMYLTVAAMNGSKIACYHLGRTYIDGASGVSVDLDIGRFWFSKIPTACDKEGFAESHSTQAIEWLERNTAT